MTLKVSDLHTLTIYECGNPKGKPVGFLHGGPSGGVNADIYYQLYIKEDNTTWTLVDDIERVGERCGVGNWGSTLALKELLWFYQKGASFLFPDASEEYLAPIPESDRGDLIMAYYKRLTGSKEEEKMKCAKAWTGWKVKASRPIVGKALVARDYPLS
ncbi:hypothetical protein SeMB42_g03454 [Synchytrium endobioticum]|uniref:Uncharacterized protein n=1 Tax=Synchytrium endobioticum TaxID=286115 RepID=A0A507D8C9_9FUNG|nr:hypothetical protein SeMB42_g03454 [Synchytrium endobioticum]